MMSQKTHDFNQSSHKKILSYKYENIKNRLDRNNLYILVYHTHIHGKKSEFHETAKITLK